MLCNQWRLDLQGGMHTPSSAYQETPIVAEESRRHITLDCMTNKHFVQTANG